MVDTTFGVLLVVLFDDPHYDCEGVGPLSFIIMTLRILGGRVASTFEKRQHKFTAWTTYVALTLCRNVDFVNFLIAVLPQSCAARKKRMHSQSLKAQLRMIAAHYRTLPQLAFEDSSLAVAFEKMMKSTRSPERCQSTSLRTTEMPHPRSEDGDRRDDERSDDDLKASSFQSIINRNGWRRSRASAT